MPPNEKLLMPNIQLILITTLLLCIFSSCAINRDETAKKLGVKQQSTETVNMQTDTINKEIGKTDSGKGYGVYGTSTEEDKKRAASPDNKEDTDAKGVGIYIEY